MRVRELKKKKQIPPPQAAEDRVLQVGMTILQHQREGVVRVGMTILQHQREGAVPVGRTILR